MVQDSSHPEDSSFVVVNMKCVYNSSAAKFKLIRLLLSYFNI